jgi:excisionase family DNA binding protein
MSNFLTTKETSERLNVSIRRVQAMITDGKLEAKKFGRDYLIDEAQLSDIQTYGKAGRPKKSELNLEETA